MTKINLYHTDCVEFMAGKPDNYYELCICDPLYGIDADNKNSKQVLQSDKSAALSKDYGNQQWDQNVPSEDYFQELLRVSKHQIIWGVNYYLYSFFSGGRIYWDKCVTMPTYSKGELAYCSKLNSIQSFKFAWHGMIQENMKHKQKRIHPTEKPVKLYEWLLENYANKGDKIFDSHGGSMSSVIACVNMEFDIDCCELDADYFRDATNRVQAHASQMDLFRNQPTINIQEAK